MPSLGAVMQDEIDTWKARAIAAEDRANRAEQELQQWLADMGHTKEKIRSLKKLANSEHDRAEAAEAMLEWLL